MSKTQSILNTEETENDLQSIVIAISLQSSPRLTTRTFLLGESISTAVVVLQDAQGRIYPSGATENTSVSRGSSSPSLDVHGEGHLICVNKDFTHLWTGVILKGFPFRLLSSDGPVFRPPPLSLSFTQFRPGPALLLWENDSVARDTSWLFQSTECSREEQYLPQFLHQSTLTMYKCWSL